MKLPIIFVLLALSAAYATKCGPNSFYTNAGSTCPFYYCSGNNDIAMNCIMTFVPVEGCFCYENFYLNREKRCVPKNECTAEDSEFAHFPGTAVRAE